MVDRDGVCKIVDPARPLIKGHWHKDGGSRSNRRRAGLLVIARETDARNVHCPCRGHRPLVASAEERSIDALATRLLQLHLS